MRGVQSSSSSDLPVYCLSYSVHMNASYSPKSTGHAAMRVRRSFFLQLELSASQTSLERPVHYSVFLCISFSAFSFAFHTLFLPPG